MYLAQKAQHDYSLAEFQTDYRKDEAAAKKKLEEARQAAEGALQAAQQNPASPEAAGAIFAAHQTLGLIALREGDRARAVRHMQESVNIVSLDPESQDVLLGTRLPTYLLKEGERESVIAFLERYAELAPVRKERLLVEARAIRDGRMPESYQRMFGTETAKR
jgi:hypothetical protein